MVVRRPLGCHQALLGLEIWEVAGALLAMRGSCLFVYALRLGAAAVEVEEVRSLEMTLALTVVQQVEVAEAQKSERKKLGERAPRQAAGEAAVVELRWAHGLKMAAAVEAVAQVQLVSGSEMSSQQPELPDCRFAEA